MMKNQQKQEQHLTQGSCCKIEDKGVEVYKNTINGDQIKAQADCQKEMDRINPPDRNGNVEVGDSMSFDGGTPCK
ncbi:hypothetical protein CON95_27180 [Bacillus toyonensis]|uniref:hypothetical protein n=1 Tax=Bacillus toyonensis TaxID=155322 RepID=UPI000BEBFBDF|nr:hypothetical protein [Bacillus toyonensis]PEE20779.1 hypothetical protein CON95_27180 [Bacillus toyonensis]